MTDHFLQSPLADLRQAVISPRRPRRRWSSANRNATVAREPRENGVHRAFRHFESGNLSKRFDDLIPVRFFIPKRGHDAQLDETLAELCNPLLHGMAPACVLCIA